MDIQDLLIGLTRQSKKDDIPGSVIGELNELCPACGKNMKEYKPCCGMPSGYKGCVCGYKIFS